MTFCTNTFEAFLLAAETSGLASSEFASVLATSGTTGTEGESSGNSWKLRHLVWVLSVHGEVMLRLQRQMRRPGNLKQWWQQWTILTCLDSQMRCLAWNMQFLRMTRINKLMGVEMMAMNTLRSMSNGTLATVMTSWKNQHTQWGLRQMTQNFFNRLMATWKTLMRPHLKCMYRQVAVFKKHVSVCLVSRALEAIFL